MTEALTATSPSEVSWLAAHGDAGMLGKNGVAPQVASLVAAAKFHGFREVRS